MLRHGRRECGKEGEGERACMRACFRVIERARGMRETDGSEGYGEAEAEAEVTLERQREG